MGPSELMETDVDGKQDGGDDDDDNDAVISNSGGGGGGEEDKTIEKVEITHGNVDGEDVPPDGGEDKIVEEEKQ